jgi:hypothetical protein
MRFKVTTTNVEATLNRILRRLVVVLLLLLPVHTEAWNRAGHYVMASIAYDQLAPNTKMQVDAILARHPDFPRWTKDVPADKRGKVAFVRASTWPDEIRTDPRFFDPGDLPTPEIPGLPSGANNRNAEWHFVNLPFTTDNTPTMPLTGPNALTKLQDFQSLATFPPQTQTYVLPWLIHIVGDVHEPLHTIAFFSRDLPNGDRGGNAIEMKNGDNLHSFWDGRLGRNTTDDFIDQTVATITVQNPKPGQISIDPAIWVQEGVDQRFFVYSFSGKGTHQDPAVVSDNYTTNAKLLTFERVARAGYRLAAFLNQKLP